MNFITFLPTHLASEKQVTSTCKPYVQCNVMHSGDLNRNPIPCFLEVCFGKQRQLAEVNLFDKAGFLLFLG